MTKNIYLAYQMPTVDSLARAIGLSEKLKAMGHRVYLPVSVDSKAGVDGGEDVAHKVYSTDIQAMMQADMIIFAINGDDVRDVEYDLGVVTGLVEAGAINPELVTCHLEQEHLLPHMRVCNADAVRDAKVSYALESRFKRYDSPNEMVADMKYKYSNPL